MLKGQKKHIDKEQGKTKHNAPRSVNYRATQNKNNIRTTALERSVVYSILPGWGGVGGGVVGGVLQHQKQECTIGKNSCFWLLNCTKGNSTKGKKNDTIGNNFSHLHHK